jgi:hypothetical protein
MAKSQVRKMDLRQLEKEINNNKTARASFVKNPAAYFEAQGLTTSSSKGKQQLS